MKLTQNQIERQDIVDNSIYQLIVSLNPTGKKISWDIEMIAKMREGVREWFVDHGICSESEFYPYLENGDSRISN